MFFLYPFPSISSSGGTPQIRACHRRVICVWNHSVLRYPSFFSPPFHLSFSINESKRFSHLPRFLFATSPSLLGNTLEDRTRMFTIGVETLSPILRSRNMLLFLYLKGTGLNVMGHSRASKKLCYSFFNSMARWSSQVLALLTLIPSRATR